MSLTSRRDVLKRLAFGTGSLLLLPHILRSAGHYKKIWNNLSVITELSPIEITAESEEEFITEHYWGYTQIRKQLTSEYGVEHPRWQTYAVKESKIEVDFDKIYGHAFSFLNTQKPDSVMLAEGSEIVVRSMNRIV